MQALIKKEYLVNKGSIIVDLIILIISPVLLFFSPNGLILGIILSCYQPISNEANEKGNDTDIFMNSLPVTREKIVFSKYLFSLMTGAFYLSIVFLMSTFIPYHEVITIKELMAGIAVVSIYLSVYYPLKYLVGQGFFVISSLGFWVILAALGYSIYNQGESFDYWGMYNSYTTYTRLQVGILSIIISFAVLTVSFRYSSRVYKKKDF
ncbi:MAG: ABC-2 transporter permease [Alkalibacterium sp.]|uniref:ABC-2 transporter permease n=1 Tax=Alkalibacterium sp. TaxID=1872447 RepID=UPI003970505B